MEPPPATLAKAQLLATAARQTAIVGARLRIAGLAANLGMEHVALHPRLAAHLRSRPRLPQVELHLQPLLPLPLVQLPLRLLQPVQLHLQVLPQPSPSALTELVGPLRDTRVKARPLGIAVQSIITAGALQPTVEQAASLGMVHAVRPVHQPPRRRLRVRRQRRQDSL